MTSSMNPAAVLLSIFFFFLKKTLLCLSSYTVHPHKVVVCPAGHLKTGHFIAVYYSRAHIWHVFARKWRLSKEISFAQVKVNGPKSENSYDFGESLWTALYHDSISATEAYLDFQLLYLVLQWCFTNSRGGIIIFIIYLWWRRWW